MPVERQAVWHDVLQLEANTAAEKGDPRNDGVALELA